MANMQAKRSISGDYGHADSLYWYSWPLPDNQNARVVNLQQILLRHGSLAENSVLKWKDGTGRNAQWVYLSTNLLRGIHQCDDERFVLYIRVEQNDPLSTVLVNMTMSESRPRLWRNFRAIAEWTRDDVKKCIREYSQALLELGQKGAGIAVQRHQVS